MGYVDVTISCANCVSTFTGSLKDNDIIHLIVGRVLPEVVKERYPYHNGTHYAYSVKLLGQQETVIENTPDLMEEVAFSDDIKVSVPFCRMCAVFSVHARRDDV